MNRAVTARSVVCLALLLLSTAWLSDTRPARGSPGPQPRADQYGRIAPATARNRLTSDAPTPQTQRLLQFDTRHAASDKLLPTHHRRQIRKRFRRRLIGPPFSIFLGDAPLSVDATAIQPDAAVDAPAPSRDHARAPPASYQHA